jgi:hypothetical protein
MRDTFLPGFRADVPWVVGEAELDDAPGLRLLARMVDDAGAPLQVGAAVTVSFVDVGEGVALPALKLTT